jgi:Domain of unknown function (DUF4919)
VTGRRARALALAVLGLAATACQTGGDGGPRAGAVAWDDPSPEFSRMRAELGERDDFSALCERDRPLRALFDAANQERWERVLDLSLPWLDQCPIDIDAHLLSAVALQKLGRPEEADPHRRWYRGLVESILASGDGRTPESAFVVISVAEEYSVLRALRLERESQALLDGGIDALQVEAEDGAESTVYFNPAAHFRRLQRMLGEAP